MTTVRDILMDADAFRRAYPDWPAPAPEKGLPMTATPCWADPLSRAERRVLAAKLAKYAHRFYWAPSAGRRREGDPMAARMARRMACAEMQDLRIDVTERAETAADDPARALGRKRAAELSGMSEDPEWLGI